MITRLLVAFALVGSALTACDPPSPTIRMFFSEGPAQSCGTGECSNISVTCGFYAGIRIVDPSEPLQPLYTRCQPLDPPRNMQAANACMLSKITLDGLQPLPYRDLQVQIAMFPEEIVDTTGDVPLCPNDTSYDARGFSMSKGPGEPPGPAIAGQAYYHPGDENIDITLGCADTGALATDCSFIASVQARATVDDFDTHVSVGTLTGGRCTTQSPANCLSVDVGEPQFLDPDYLLNPAGLTMLDRVVPDPGSPAWFGSVSHLFTARACLVVKEEIPESTTTATCTDEEELGASPIGPTTKNLDLVGKRLSKASLDQILAAAGLSAPPPDGITIGIVLDRGSPISGQTVTVDNVPNGGTATIEYLNSNRTGIGGTTTSSGANGAVFISRDAPFGTEFHSMKMLTRARQIGGRIRDKVTIVILDVGITVTGTD